MSYPRTNMPAVSRVLRLVIAAGIPAAGLCLVIGLTTLIVKVGAPSGAGPFVGAPEALHPVRAGSGTPPSRSDHGQAMAKGSRVMRSYQGSGRGRSGPFRVGKPGTWGLEWAFRCGGHQDGQFLVTGRSALIGNEITVAAWGPAGRGITWARSDPGRHVLTVRSRCRWEITVVLPTRPG